MPYLDDSSWQEIAKWFAGLAATVVGLFLMVLRGWAGDRFREMDERLDDHEKTIKKHDQELSDQHETLTILMERVDTGKEDRKRIQDGVDRINEKIDRLVERC